MFKESIRRGLPPLPLKKSQRFSERNIYKKKNEKSRVYFIDALPNDLFWCTLATRYCLVIKAFIYIKHMYINIGDIGKVCLLLFVTCKKQEKNIWRVEGAKRGGGKKTNKLVTLIYKLICYRLFVMCVHFQPLTLVRKCLFWRGINERTI